MFLKRLFVKIWSLRSFISRVGFCWAMGIAFLFFDESQNFDQRFRLRGEFLKSNNIVLVLISESDWASFSSPDFNFIRPMKEVGYLTDSYYWQEETWGLLLDQLLKSNPAGIGVSFYFGENISRLSENPYRKHIFQDPRIVWGAQLDSEGRVLFPRFSGPRNTNTGLLYLPTDSDGIVRRLPKMSAALPEFGKRLVQAAGYKTPSNLKVRPINFHGPPISFQTMQIERILKGQIKPAEVEGKFIIIGSKDSPGHLLPTPLGLMTKAEIMANVTDNTIRNQWIKIADRKIYIAFLGIILLISVLIIRSYPQAVALVFCLCLAAVIVSLSTWSFDSQFFWIPVLAPLIQLFVTFVIFLSYQLSLNEKKNWQLEQEKKYLFEIEQLKNNFVSLFSHDLKTPIAKFQAIVDRLLRSSRDEELMGDLATLRSTSLDLHRYIQTILNITRVESQDFRLQKTAVDINEVIQKVIEEIGTLAQEKKLNISTQLAPLFSIEIDADLIHEVVLNLIENAVKYSNPGGQITVISDEIDDFVVVRVIDNGDGIEPEEVVQIWNKFYRGKKHGMTTKGTGLGLYLVKYFIELHGGKVSLKSQIGAGTEVSFQLPLAES